MCRVRGGWSSWVIQASTACWPHFDFPGINAEHRGETGIICKKSAKSLKQQGTRIRSAFISETSVGGFPQKKGEEELIGRKVYKESGSSLKTISWSIALLVHQTSGVFSGSAQIKSREQNDCNV